MRVHFNRNHKELEERMLECDPCDDTCTKKDTLIMHKGVKHKAKLSNCDKCDYTCTKNKVPVMRKFRKHGGQEPQRKLCELCDFTQAWNLSWMHGYYPCKISFQWGKIFP